MGHAFKTFKGDMNKLVQASIQPNFDIEYTKQREFWEEFKEYKLSDVALAASAKNKANSLKATYHHWLGSRGYIRKVPEWDKKLADMERRGVMPQTNDW